MGKRISIWLKRCLIASSISFVVLFLLAHALREEANPDLFPANGTSISVDVVDHGYHAGLILPREVLLKLAASEGLTRLEAVLRVFDRFEKIEFGWGEKEFYRNVPAANFSATGHVARAMFNPYNASVLHVVGFDGETARAFPASERITLLLSDEGLRRVANFIDSSVQNTAAIGPGLYGPSAFFDAVGQYSILNTCNHWIGRALWTAGLPYAPVEAFISRGLLFDLKRRAISR